MKIKEVAERLNISPRAIRFYEEKGLISPLKQADNRYRSFGEQDVWRLQTIISLREAGMTIEDIKQALAGMDGNGHNELQYYLELQRSVLFAKWLEIKQIIETTDEMIDMLQTQDALPLEDIYRLAEGSKRLRDQRSHWRDQWDFDRLAGSHDERVANDSFEFKDYEAALDMAVTWISAIPGEKGLDIGTGTGNLAGKFISLGIGMAGVDQSKEMLKQCRTKFPELEAKLGNFLALPFLDGKFDFAVTSFAFHHLTDEQKRLAIDEMRRVLKPHGRICIADLMIAEGRKSGPTGRDRTEQYVRVPDLIGWLEEKGYFTKSRQINEWLHLVYAIPIR
ncbi:MerR family transcriptional regulator [Paenibacillus sp. M1]|uniref:MerR family transcriptional regulator n=1 Tax=Paenibacillus haidiansis TaxID=1574488 RepID=A0ABU7VTE2_9BACL